MSNYREKIIWVGHKTYFWERSSFGGFYSQLGLCIWTWPNLEILWFVCVCMLGLKFCVCFSYEAASHRQVSLKRGKSSHKQNTSRAQWYWNARKILARLRTHTECYLYVYWRPCFAGYNFEQTYAMYPVHIYSVLSQMQKNWVYKINILLTKKNLGVKS